jgi:hypothetical protein
MNNLLTELYFFSSPLADPGVNGDREVGPG